jgi:hypothetical protein
MAKRRRRKRGKVRWLMIVAIALLIAGFMARRLLMPGAARYLSHRAPDYPAAPPQSDGRSDGTDSDNPSEAHAHDNGSGEHLNDRDRRALDEVIRRKTGSH